MMYCQVVNGMNYILLTFNLILLIYLFVFINYILMEVNMMLVKLPKGMKDFLILWSGQLFSLLGTSMTAFALTLWAWQITGKATSLALVGFFHFLPTLIFSPLAGALVDRWNRKTVMILSDVCSGLATFVIFLLLLSGKLQIWHLYIAASWSGIFQSLQFPAYSAAIGIMVPKEQFARTTGLTSMTEAGVYILSPVLAGACVGFIGVKGVLIIDLITLMLAVSTIALVKIPHPKTSATVKNSLWKDSLFGFRYIWVRKPLLGLLGVFFLSNLFGTLGQMVYAPMILSRTGNNQMILGAAQSFFGIGGVVGGLLVGIWGGPKRKGLGVILGVSGSSLLGAVFFGIGDTLFWWSIGGLLVSIFGSISHASSQAIWMSKVPPEFQGRVFSSRRFIAQCISPIAMLVSGPLADKFFEPMMLNPSGIFSLFTRLVGSSKGSGMALMMFIFGILGVLAGLWGYMNPMIRDVDRVVPDHDESLEEAEEEDPVSSTDFINFPVPSPA